MDQQKIAKHLIDLNEMHLDCNTNTVSALHVDSEQRFFRFVDKSPLLSDNTIDAIYESLVSTRKYKYEYRSMIDENHDIPAGCFISYPAHKGNK